MYVCQWPDSERFICKCRIDNYRGAQFFVNETNACHLDDPLPCYLGFGRTIAGRNGSFVIASPISGLLGSVVTQGTVFTYTGPLTSGQVIDIRAAVQNLQATSLWDMNSASFDQLGFRMIDGEDVRIISVPGSDGKRGKLVFVPASGLPRGNVDVTLVTQFTLTGVEQGGLFSHALARAEDGSILVSARGFRNTGNGGEFYYIPTGAILF